MHINWPLAIVVFFLSLPGVLIAIPRLINLLLTTSSDSLKKRIRRLAVGQTLLMVVLVSIAGSALSVYTGLGDPLLEALLKGGAIHTYLQEMLLPILLYTAGGLVVFFILYYRVVSVLLDSPSLHSMQNMRAALNTDGCVLYGGIVEEILARWGLMNVIAFFGMLYTGQKSASMIWTAIVLSSLIFTLSQFPAYIAAGCLSSRRFIYSLLLLNGWQALIFGLLFWRYGLLAAILAHMLFHLGWSLYDKPRPLDEELGAEKKGSRH